MLQKLVADRETVTLRQYSQIDITCAQLLEQFSELDSWEEFEFLILLIPTDINCA